MPESRIQAVDHVNMEGRKTDADKLEQFYIEIAQLDKVSPPEDVKEVLCFKSETIELRVSLSDAPKIDGVAVRVTIAVASLEELEDTLREHRMLVEKISGLTSTDHRIHTLDPSGNRVEFIRVPHWSPV